MQSHNNRNHIIVLGAGVTGLQSALHLLRTGDYDVTIVAKHLPSDGENLRGEDIGEYASPWAGAHWRPHAGPADLEEQGWDMKTYRDWLRTARVEEYDGTPEHERSGIAVRRSILEWDAVHPEVQPNGLNSLWFKSRVDGFRPLETHGGHIDMAAHFTSMTVNVPVYLKYLQRNIEREGGVLIRTTLPLEHGMDATLAAAQMAVSKTGRLILDGTDIAGKDSTEPKITAYINATGINARILCKDTRVIPIRGQTVLVEGEARQIRNRKGKDPSTGELYSAYAIPRVGSNTTVLGGCHVKGDWNLNSDPVLTERILDWGRELCPELLTDDEKGRRSFVVRRVMVGLRPGRERGARVEGEWCGAEGAFVVHAYGNGGAGYQNSVGVANKVVRLLKQGLRDGKL